MVFFRGKYNFSKWKSKKNSTGYEFTVICKISDILLVFQGWYWKHLHQPHEDHGRCCWTRQVILTDENLNFQYNTFFQCCGAEQFFPGSGSTQKFSAPTGSAEKNFNFKSFRFSLGKKISWNRPKMSVPGPDKILNRLRLQLKILSSDWPRLCYFLLHKMLNFYETTLFLLLRCIFHFLEMLLTATNIFNLN